MERRWSAGLIAVAGGLGVIIPPSIPFVLYSMATGVSTGDLFLGGVLPGILIGLFMMIYAVVYCLRKGEDKEGPGPAAAVPGQLLGASLPRHHPGRHLLRAVHPHRGGLCLGLLRHSGLPVHL